MAQDSVASSQTATGKPETPNRVVGIGEKSGNQTFTKPKGAEKKDVKDTM